MWFTDETASSTSDMIKGYFPELLDKLLTVMREFPLSRPWHCQIWHFPYANLFSGVLILGYSEKSDTFSQLFIVGDVP